MATAKDVKVRAVYQSNDDAATLWGIDFVKDGDDLVATLSKDDANLMVIAGRVEIV